MRSLAVFSIVIAMTMPISATTPVAFVDVTVIPMDRDVELPFMSKS